MKLPAHSAGLPGNDLLLNIVSLDPAHRAGLAGHAPVILCCQGWGSRGIGPNTDQSIIRDNTSS